MTLKNLNKKIIIKAVIIFVIVAGIAASFIIINLSKRVAIDAAEIYAPKIDLSAKAGGPLNEVMVKAGDLILENQVAARVGNELVKAGNDGLVVGASGNLGKNFNPGEAIVSVINPKDLRIVAHLDEDKGLKDIHVGQKVIFTVDAFGGKKYLGVVDEISEVSRSSAVVFSISDKREVKQFDIKIRFSLSDYPELKNGMSAKVKIYK